MRLKIYFLSVDKDMEIDRKLHRATYTLNQVCVGGGDGGD